MKAFALVGLGLTAASYSWAGNGSSGIGNASIPVGEDFAVEAPADKYRAEQGAIVNQSDGSIVLRFEEIGAAEAEKEKKQSVAARIGAVKGWEYLPDHFKDPGGENRWAACSAQGRCVSLRAVNKYSRSAAAILGTLQSK